MFYLKIFDTSQRMMGLAQEIITVSQLNENIKYILEETFGFVWVEGEISNLRRPQSGHVYFTLKDDKSQVRAVYFKQFGRYRQGVSFELEEGLHILCRAKVSVYTPRGEYQLIVESAEPRGVGALQKLFEQLKVKLAAEGLFDEKYKKTIPFLPRIIGVITSPSGAVIKDILNITARRFPSVDLIIAPVRVQGAEATREIVQALRNLHADGRTEVIIIARGGGSLEDLAPFNDEMLAREIFHSSIPIVSAVGHETDFTICDFVADLRAPTPSAAAELVVPEREELLKKLQKLDDRIKVGLLRCVEEKKDELDELKTRLRDPRRLLADWQIHLDVLRDRLKTAFHHIEKNLYTALRQRELRLLHQSPARKIEEKKEKINNIGRNMRRIFSGRLALYNEQLRRTAVVLESLSPLNVLRRGYSITRSMAGNAVIRRADELRVGDDVNIRLAEGSIDARVKKISRE
ncbi:MAG TPA: exodeoxyribonuclease VII large subunit [Smithellaceae bacterium]|nr:exodeoxyribonuclease VII large subunit [Smithellaceae bacterium]